MKNQFASRCLYLWVSLWLAFLAHAQPGPILLDQKKTVLNCVIPEWPELTEFSVIASATEDCQEYVMDRQSASSGPGKLRVTVCSVETANPEKGYVIFTGYPDPHVWLCRNESEQEAPRQTAPPILTITIVDRQTDDPDNEIPAVFGGGYGSDSFDDWRPGKPGMPGGGVVPLFLGMVSAGVWPAELINFAYGLKLPELSGSAPIAFQQGLMSDNSEILVIVSETRQQFYQRATLFGRWQLMGQINTSAISSVEWSFEDDVIAENKILRALVGAFGWKYDKCGEVPGLLGCPKGSPKSSPKSSPKRRKQEREQPANDQGTSSSTSRDSGSGNRQSHGDSGKSSGDQDDQKEDGNPAQHVHQGPVCPHPDCHHRRCCCVDCKAKGDISNGTPVSVDQAFSVLGEHISQYNEMAILLGVPYGNLTEIGTPEMSIRMKRVLELAEASGVLTAERLVMAMSFLIGTQIAKDAAMALRVSYSDAIPDCYLESAKPDDTDLMALRDAYLIATSIYIDPFRLAVEMGLPYNGHEVAEQERDFEFRKIKLLWLLQKHGLLTYGRFLSAANYVKPNSKISEASQKLGVALQPRQPDYQVFSDDRLKALTQRLSLRDLVDIVDCMIPEIIVTRALGCPERIVTSVSVIKDSQERMLKLLALCMKHICMKHKKGNITVNDVIKNIFYHPEVMHYQKAHRLVEKLTGASPDQEAVSAEDMMVFDGQLANLKEFGLALGVPERVITNIFCSFNNAWRQWFEIVGEARSLDRLTPENLVYALQNSENSDRVALLKSLNGITGQRLPDETPVYLSEEESGQASEEPMVIEAGSERLTLEHYLPLPLSHNWFWIGMAMGLSNKELVVIEKTCSFDPRECLYRMLKALTSKCSSYETGHLYNVVRFLGDQAAIDAFPAHLRCDPNKALATVEPSSPMAHAMIAVADAFSHDPEAFGQQLELPKDVINLAKIQYKRDPRRIIVELIQKALNRCAIRYPDLWNRLIEAVASLPPDIPPDIAIPPDIGHGLPEAVAWTERTAQRSQASGLPFSKQLGERLRLR